MLQPLMPCLHALTSALEGLLAALPQAYLADTFLQELLVQSLLSMLSAASSLSSQSQQGATQPEAGEGLAGMLFAAADKLTQQLTDADLDGRTPPTWVVLPLWQCAIELLESCQDGETSLHLHSWHLSRLYQPSMAIRLSGCHSQALSLIVTHLTCKPA